MDERKSYAARMDWVHGLQFVAHGETSGATTVFDGAPEHGGSNQGIRPMEGLLMSLAGCTGMDVMSILKKKRQRVSQLRVNIHGLAAAEFPKRFEQIELEYVVQGEDLSEAAVARAIELSMTKYCPVTANLNAEITYTYRLEQDEA